MREKTEPSAEPLSKGRRKEKDWLEITKNDENISASNKQDFENYIEFLKSEGKHSRTIKKHTYFIAHFLRALGNVNAREATREDLIAAVNRIRFEDETKGTQAGKQGYAKVLVRAFYKHLLGEDADYPKVVASLKHHEHIKREKLKPEDLLSKAEIMRMLDVTTDIRDKAIIALLYDAGLRCGELINLQKDNVSLTAGDKFGHVTVPKEGKTGQRVVPITFSAPFLALYFNTYKDLKPDEPLFMWNGTWKNGRDKKREDRSIGRAAVSKVIKHSAKKAGIHKRVFPHLLRHSSCTNRARDGLNEQLLKKLYGWTGSSRMAEVYTHMDNKDVDDAVLKADGLTDLIKDEAEKSREDKRIISRVCDTCNTVNTADAIYCTKCGNPLDVVRKLKKQEIDYKIEGVSELIEKSLENPEFLEEVVHRYLMKKRERGIK